MSQENTSEDYQAIVNVVDKYFSGTQDGKPELLNEAYLESAELQFSEKEGVRRIPIATYIGFFKPGVKPKRKGHLVSIDVAGKAAMAKAVIHMRGKIYTDYFLLLKVNNEWKIANKISSHT